MIILRALSILVVTSIMLYSTTVSFAVTVNGVGPTKSQGTNTSPNATSGNTISKVTAFVKTMDDNVLVLEDNRQYDLSNVKVITKSDNHTSGKTVVEMTFMNNTLQQVVIH